MVGSCYLILVHCCFVSQLASALAMPEIGQQKQHALVRVKATMHTRDDQITLEPPEHSNNTSLDSLPMMYGDTSAGVLLTGLLKVKPPPRFMSYDELSHMHAQDGIDDAKLKQVPIPRAVDEGQTNCTIEIPSLGAVLHLGYNQTHIETEDEKTRSRLTSVVSSCLNCY